MQLPGAVQTSDEFGFGVPNKGKLKGFLWLWKERINPKKPRVPNPDVIALSVASLSAKEVLLGTGSSKIFTEPHYNGFPAVLVRLSEIEPGELEDLIIEAWRCKAPAEAVTGFDAKA